MASSSSLAAEELLLFSELLVLSLMMSLFIGGSCRMRRICSSFADLELVTERNASCK